MDSAKNTTKPTTYRGTFRRHRVLLSLPLVLGVLGAAAFIGTHTTSYTSNASLWVDTAPPTPSSVGPGAAGLAQQPAQAEQSLLGELMTTNQFAVAVANGSLLGRAIGDPAEIEAKAASYVTTSQVGSLVTGPQVLALSYTASSPTLARSVLQAIISELIHEGSGLGAAHVHASITYYKALLAEQSSIVTSATANVTAYLAQHPNASPQTDPNLSSRVAAENAANQQLSQTKSALSQAQGAASNTSAWMVDVVDTPSAALASVFSKKKMVEVVLGGLIAGGLISFLGVLSLLPKAPKERWEDELPASGASSQQWVGEPVRAGLTLTGTGDRVRDREEAAPSRGQSEPARGRRGAGAVVWRR